MDEELARYGNLMNTDLYTEEISGVLVYIEYASEFLVFK